MKIGYLMQSGVPDVWQVPSSGPANHVKHTIEELKSLGHEVRLLACFDYQVWKSEDLEDYEIVSVQWLDKGVFGLLERVVRRFQAELRLPYVAWFESFRFAHACWHELRGYDVLYERMGWMGYGGALAARWLKIPLILEVNGDHLTELTALGLAPRTFQRWLSLMLMKRMVHSAIHTVATGDGWRTRFIQQWAVKPERVTTVENGSELVNMLKREQLRSFQDGTEEAGVTKLVFVGSFDAWQGITILLQAVARALRQGMQVHLFLIGSGSGVDDLNKLIDGLNIKDRVTFTGQLPASELARYLAQADIGVSPYCGRVEFSGLKLLDYKAAGLAIIASGQNGQPFILKHGQTGWIVPPCDVGALTEAIIHLSTNSFLRRQLGRAARIEAENCHSWTHTARQLDRLFSKVISK